MTGEIRLRSEWSEAPWRFSPCYRDLSTDGFKLVSFDIFDTLLHRAARRPAAIFQLMGQRARHAGLLDTALDAHAFSRLRAKMEVEARKARRAGRNSNEVTLAEIWAQAPSFLGDVGRWMALELDTEYAVSFGNPYGLSFLREVRGRGLRVCLTSDTYFSTEFVRSLLSKAGLAENEYDALLVSCEHDANKASGTLFPLLRERFSPVRYQEILHIGDDLTTDVLQPERYGISCVHLKSSHPSSSLLQAEALLGLKDGEDHIAAVRHLGQAVAEAEGSRQDFFLEFGAARLGPAMAAFATWVVNEAVERGVTKICPIMREGAVLAPFMRSAAEALGVSVEVEELYASRAAAFLPLMGELSPSAIEQYKKRRNFTLRDLAAELRLPAPPDAMLSSWETPLERIPVAELSQWLAMPQVREAARAASSAARELMIEYMDAVFGEHASIALVDFGSGGNTSAWISECFAGRGRNFSHFLFYSTANVVPNLAKGHLYGVFCGSSPEVMQMCDVIRRSPEPLETLMTGARQTTLTYGRDTAGKAGPILAEAHNSAKDLADIATCERGMELAWLHFEHVLRSVPLDHLMSEATRSASLSLLYRVIELPNAAEATFLGDLLFDDNDGSRSCVRICGAEDRAKLLRIGPEQYVSRFRRRWGDHADGTRWPQGVLTREFPAFLFQTRRQAFNDSDYMFICQDLVDRAVAAGFGTASVYGGGKVGHEVVLCANERGLDVDYVIDSNPATHGSAVGSRLVVSLSTAQQTGCGVYIVASLAFAEAISSTIRQHYAGCGLDCPPIISVLDT